MGGGSGTHPEFTKTQISCRGKVKQKKIASIRGAGVGAGKSVSQFLFLMQNGWRNIKIRRGGEGTTLRSEWPPTGGLL